MDPLELSFGVDCPPERAFELWAERTSMWWPHGHSVSGEPGLTVAFEPRPGGRIYERTPAGEEHDWGEVLDWEPPRRLRYRRGWARVSSPIEGRPQPPRLTQTVLFSR
jgi:uncharacterized protein YndB with AHSA1/START domain